MSSIIASSIIVIVARMTSNLNELDTSCLVIVIDVLDQVEILNRSTITCCPSVALPSRGPFVESLDAEVGVSVNLGIVTTISGDLDTFLDRLVLMRDGEQEHEGK